MKIKLFNRIIEITLKKPSVKKPPLGILTNLLKDPKICFIADKNTKVYHHKYCYWLNILPEENLCDAGQYPEANGYIPCPDCRPYSGYLRRKAFYMEARKRFNGRTMSKYEVLKRELEIVAQGFGYHVSCSGGTATITSISSEWYFLINDRPIKLRHRNKDGKDGYHMQPVNFFSPLEVLVYIREHDMNEIERNIKYLNKF